MGICDALRLNRPATLMEMAWPLLWGVILSGGLSFSNTVLAFLLAFAAPMAAFIYFDLIGVAPERLSSQYRKAGRGTLVFLLALMTTLFLGFASALGGLTLFFSLLWVVFVAAYPLMYRLLYLPQIYLGFVLGIWPVLIGQSVVEDMTPLAALVAFAAFFWVCATETLRADIREMLESSSQRSAALTLPLGNLRIPFMAGCFLLTLILFVFAGLVGSAHAFFYIGLMVAQLLLSHAFGAMHLQEHVAARRTYGRAAWAGGFIAIALLWL